jgi:hypothetical protein
LSRGREAYSTRGRGVRAAATGMRRGAAVDAHEALEGAAAAPLSARGASACRAWGGSSAAT